MLRVFTNFCSTVVLDGSSWQKQLGWRVEGWVIQAPLQARKPIGWKSWSFLWVLHTPNSEPTTCISKFGLHLEWPLETQHRARACNSFHACVLPETKLLANLRLHKIRNAFFLAGHSSIVLIDTEKMNPSLHCKPLRRSKTKCLKKSSLRSVSFNLCIALSH